MTNSLRILEYNPNFGTISAGFENFGENEVTDVLKLSKDAEYGYNSIHKQWFSASFSSISSYEPKKSVDLAIFNPEFGEKVNRKGAANFFFSDFQNCLDFLDLHYPKFAIFQTEPDAIKYINTAPEYVRDGFGSPSRDQIIYSLSSMGYKSYLLVINEAGYGIPLHRKFAFYIAVPEDFILRVPKPLFTATGKGNYSKYRTVGDAIGDLDKMGEWVPYGCEAQNSYQKIMQNEKTGKTTWHHTSKIRDTTKKKIKYIKQGSNNDTSVPKCRSKGYNRAKWDAICRGMDEQFYLATSKLGDSIHPTQNRPFTIREGCRIHGLPDRLSFDLKTSKSRLAKLIHNSPSPLIGEILAISMGYLP